MKAASSDNFMGKKNIFYTTKKKNKIDPFPRDFREHFIQMTVYHLHSIISCEEERLSLSHFIYFIPV